MAIRSNCGAGLYLAQTAIREDTALDWCSCKTKQTDLLKAIYLPTPSLEYTKCTVRHRGCVLLGGIYGRIRKSNFLTIIYSAEFWATRRGMGYGGIDCRYDKWPCIVVSLSAWNQHILYEVRFMAGRVRTRTVPPPANTRLCLHNFCARIPE